MLIMFYVSIDNVVFVVRFTKARGENNLFVINNAFILIYFPKNTNYFNQHAESKSNKYCHQFYIT